MTFAQPYWLWLLALLPVLIFLYGRSVRKRHVSLMVSRLSAMSGNKTWVVYARNWLQWLRWVVMALLIVAMARPQLIWHEDQTEAEAIDIMMVVDVSPSMLSKDFTPDRLTAVKTIVNDFIERRKYDRIGLTIFSGGAFTQCPLTEDHRLLKVFVNNMQVGRLPNGTAMGTGLATAISHMKDSTTLSKVAIVITDGENNTGNVGPMQAAGIAAALGVHTYVIGIGRDGAVQSPASQNMDGSYRFITREMQLDTVGLSAMARIGGGKFFRAENMADLKDIYTSIDQLEKSKITINKINRTSELYFWFLSVAISLMALELMLRWGALRVITV